eukprot:m.31886 g.31886  ORF g.31886 m.31886 type:complete len:268 (+) comp5424_c0_seq1:54-857(+)
MARALLLIAALCVAAAYGASADKCDNACSAQQECVASGAGFKCAVTEASLLARQAAVIARYQELLVERDDLREEQKTINTAWVAHNAEYERVRAERENLRDQQSTLNDNWDSHNAEFEAIRSEREKIQTKLANKFNVIPSTSAPAVEDETADRDVPEVTVTDEVFIQSTAEKSVGSASTSTSIVLLSVAAVLVVLVVAVGVLIRRKEQSRRAAIALSMIGAEEDMPVVVKPAKATIVASADSEEPSETVANLYSSVYAEMFPEQQTV